MVVAGGGLFWSSSFYCSDLDDFDSDEVIEEGSLKGSLGKEAWTGTTE